MKLKYIRMALRQGQPNNVCFYSNKFLTGNGLCIIKSIRFSRVRWFTSPKIERDLFIIKTSIEYFQLQVRIGSKFLKNSIARRVSKYNDYKFFKARLGIFIKNVNREVLKSFL